jgi:predicted dehydrogenase
LRLELTCSLVLAKRVWEDDVLQVGLLGAGTMGRIHADSISRSGTACVSKVYGLDSTDESLAEQHGATSVEAAEEIFRDPEIDIVVIATPTNTHAKYLRTAHASGKHIFCEKPVVRHEAEIDEIQQLYRDYPKQVMAGHVVRFSPEYCFLRDTLQAGSLGNIGTVRFGRCGTFPRGQRDWFGDYEQSGGVILDLMIHDMDTLRWCFGDIERVYCMRSVAAGSPPQEYALAAVRLRSGAIAHLEGSWAESPGTFYTNYEVCGSGGLLEYDSRVEPTLVLHGKKESDAATGGVMVPQNPAVLSPYEREMLSYLNSVKMGTPVEVTLDDGLNAVSLSLAAIRSATENRPVEMQG